MLPLPISCQSSVEVFTVLPRALPPLALLQCLSLRWGEAVTVKSATQPYTGKKRPTAPQKQENVNRVFKVPLGSTHLFQACCSN